MRTTRPTRRRLVEDHLRRVSGGALSGPALRDATAAVFENYARYWAELFRLQANMTVSLDATFTCDGYDNLRTALGGGRGVIMALPHVGNWDLAGAWLAGRGHRITVVTERVEPPELFEWFSARRRTLGMDVIGLDDSAVGAIVRALQRNHVVCLMADRDLSGDGIPVEFFGAPTTMPGGPALLALRTGAPLLPVGACFGPPGYHGAHILPPVTVARAGRLRDDVARLTQELARSFEGLIAAAPEQWLVMQPVWETGHGAMTVNEEGNV